MGPLLPLLLAAPLAAQTLSDEIRIPLTAEGFKVFVAEGSAPEKSRKDVYFDAFDGAKFALRPLKVRLKDKGGAKLETQVSRPAGPDVAVSESGLTATLRRTENWEEKHPRAKFEPLAGPLDEFFKKAKAGQPARREGAQAGALMSAAPWLGHDVVDVAAAGRPLMPANRNVKYRWEIPLTLEDGKAARAVVGVTVDYAENRRWELEVEVPETELGATLAYARKVLKALASRPRPLRPEHIETAPSPDAFGPAEAALRPPAP